ncbi:hypothetical protein G9A89_011656 [Geosiphon pyriformis]|nr:hypothetical protein G9A89_011656 [Geosiphon pyriformis]
MEPVGFVAGGAGSVLAGLGTQSGVKNKHLVGSQSHGVSYKKPKKPVVVDSLVESSAGVSNVIDKSGDGPNIRQLWASKVNSEVDSISGISDLDNLDNVITEETSYAESDASGLDDDMNDVMPKKMCTRTYVLNSKPPLLFFNVPSDSEDTLPLLSPKFYGSNHVSPVRSCALVKRNFNLSKSFALDIEISAIPGKTNGDKLVSIKKIFYQVDGFGGAFTPSKFPGIIRSTFTSEASMNKAKSLAVSEKILVNNELRKVNSCSNWEIVVKKIPVNLPKLAVELVFSKFNEIVLIRMQLIGLWQKTLVEFKSAEIADMVVSKWSVFMSKNSMRVALAIDNKQLWVSRDQYRALLYTLPVGTMAHDLSDMLESYDGKTCFIGHNPVSYICDRCAIVCFDNKAAKLAAVSIILIFKSVSLHWTSLVLASCTKCKQFGHIHADCSMGRSSGAHRKKVVSDQNRVCLAGIYKKKLAPIACPVLFGGKTWAQVASGTPFHAFFSGFSGSGLHSDLVPPLAVSDPLVISHLSGHLAILEHSLELLADYVSGILVRLDSFALGSEVNSDMIVDNALSSSGITSPVTDDAVINLSASDSKVFTAKVGSLETKLVTLKALVGLVLNKLNLLCSGSVWKIAICNVRGMNNYAKQADIVHWHKDINNLVSIVTETKLKGKICPWITNRFDGVRVFLLGLNSGHMGSGIAIILNSSLARHVCKLLSVRLLFKNKLSVSILGLYTGASLVVCFSQAGVINSFIAKVINESSFIIFGGDFNEDGSHKCASFNKCFDLGLVNSLGGSLFVKSPTWCNSCGVAKTIDYVFVSSNLINVVVDRSVAGVDDFFDTNHKAVFVSVSIGELLDKFDIKCASEVKWLEFKNAMADNASMFSGAFVMARKFSDMNEIWNIVRKIMVLSVDRTFKKKWFKSFDSVFNKVSFRFHKLELLVFKLVRNSHLVFNKLNSFGASVVRSLFFSSSGFGLICSMLAKARKLYCASKLLESKCTEKSSIKQAINKRIKSFELDKGHTIRSVLERSFYKIVLDYLVVGDKLVLEPDSVKSKHVFDGAFSGVMCPISFDEMLAVVKNLPDRKVASLFGISNELWKCCNKVMTDFGLTDGYCVHDGLDQGEIFSSLLWHIFYDSLLCEVKKQDSVYGYRLNSHFISKTGQMDPQAGLSSFLATGAFVDDTIWVGSSQAATQCILDVANEFFRFNNISVNNDKTVTISINWQVLDPHLTISGVPISIAKKGESHCYLGIFLSFKSFSKPSLAKAQANVWFFVNLVLKKAVSDKQCAYLVSVDALVCKILKSKSGLHHDFSNDALHHLSLYSLKTFEQIQAESKLASAITFVNSTGILGRLFSYRSHDLQVLSWCPRHSLLGVVPLSLGFSLMDGCAVSDVHLSHDFGVVCNTLLTIDAAHLSVYTDGSLSGLGIIDVKAGAAVFFEDINLGLGVGVSGLVSSIMMELQAIALALKCIPSSHLIDLFSDSQATLDAYGSKFLLIHLDFRNCCWIEYHYIATVIHRKNLDVNWVKIKGYLSVSDNEHADALAKDTALSAWCLSYLVSERFLYTRDAAVSVWHTDSHLASGFTSIRTTSCRTYFMKALHFWLPVTVPKRLYDRRYSSVVCLFCGDIEISDHVFLCLHNATGHACLLDAHALAWEILSGLFHSSSCVL